MTPWYRSSLFSTRLANPCISNPCNGRGQCYFWPNATYYCICYTNFVGSNCQYASPSNTNTNVCLTTRPCLNGGTCVPAAGSSQYTCQCLPNYLGQNCQWTSEPLQIECRTSSNATNFALDSLSITTTSTMTPITASPSALRCGLSQVKAPVDYDRIVNGQSVYTYSWPWLVSLQTSAGSHFVSRCLLAFFLS